MTVTEKLRELAAKVPGLTEFLEREDLREQDKLLREHTAERMGKIKNALAELKRALLAKMKLGLLDDLDRLGQQVDRLRDKQRFAAYGYTGAFDKQQINEPELQALLDADMEILDRVESLLETCADTVAGDVDEDAVKVALGVLQGEINQLATLIESRGNAGEKLGL